MTDTRADERVEVPEPGARPSRRRLAVRWWPALAGLPLSIVVLVQLEPWRPSNPTTAILPGLAHRRTRRLTRLQLPNPRRTP
jgi:hypothetical protein